MRTNLEFTLVQERPMIASGNATELILFPLAHIKSNMNVQQNNKVKRQYFD